MSIRGSLLSAIHSLFLSPRRMVILECLERMLRDLRSRAATKVTHVRQSGSSAWWRWLWRACYRVRGLWRERMSRWGWEQKCRHFDAIFVNRDGSALAALEVAKMATSHATNDENFIKMTTFPFPWIQGRLDISLKPSIVIYGHNMRCLD